uniref:Uncharacterized protein n=1 Tax=Chromera velia CCMP2878 TaxID=1169474 RepID=A0A0G4GYX3_9ALVE|eukprot:Cvel_23936.t1-p1 / transcript=Cvel_23936.t1 / gene=Cvel_23936 / organism=Chromera_velia_CCMP2878 / gene_product=hypothetical protein / transcript_product=hypothetical protein / location=Cvel_scaffold2529:5281-8278(+) / protein_length=602 / sequence_SO=supercontig / SO=protein_coding / is_pseudo=false
MKKLAVPALNLEGVGGGEGGSSGKKEKTCRFLTPPVLSESNSSDLCADPPERTRKQRQESRNHAQSSLHLSTHSHGDEAASSSKGLMSPKSRQDTNVFESHEGLPRESKDFGEIVDELMCLFNVDSPSEILDIAHRLIDPGSPKASGGVLHGRPFPLSSSSSSSGRAASPLRDSLGEERRRRASEEIHSLEVALSYEKRAAEKATAENVQLRKVIENLSQRLEDSHSELDTARRHHLKEIANRDLFLNSARERPSSLQRSVSFSNSHTAAVEALGRRVSVSGSYRRDSGGQGGPLLSPGALGMGTGRSPRSPRYSAAKVKILEARVMCLELELSHKEEELEKLVSEVDNMQALLKEERQGRLTPQRDDLDLESPSRVGGGGMGIGFLSEQRKSSVSSLAGMSLQGLLELEHKIATSRERRSSAASVGSSRVEIRRGRPVRCRSSCISRGGRGRTESRDSEEEEGSCVVVRSLEELAVSGESSVSPEELPLAEHEHEWEETTQESPCSIRHRLRTVVCSQKGAGGYPIRRLVGRRRVGVGDDCRESDSPCQREEDADEVDVLEDLRGFAPFRHFGGRCTFSVFAKKAPGSHEIIRLPSLSGIG